jgi:TPR repeat protein
MKRAGSPTLNSGSNKRIELDIQAIIDKAEAGEIKAQLALAGMYENGINIEKDLYLAVYWYAKVSIPLIGSANRMPVDESKLRKAAPPKQCKIITDCLEEATQGNPSAQFLLGRLYKTFVIFLPQYGLPNGLLYFRSEPVIPRWYKKDYKQQTTKAEEWYLAAANQGHALAAYKIGKILRKKNDNDIIAALEWFRKSIAKGFDKAKNSIQECLQIMKDLAQDGDAYYQYTLGTFYTNGYEHVVEKNYREAIKWYGLAAEQNHIQAKNNLHIIYNIICVEPVSLDHIYIFGVFYQNGWGVTKNLERAIHNYKIAASYEDPDAHCKLGIMHQHGLGMHQNLEEAIACYKIAIQNGNIEAKELIKTVANADVYNIPADVWMRIFKESGLRYNETGILSSEFRGMVKALNTKLKQ